MRILHLLSQTILTGAESYAIDLSNELSAQGHQVWICSDTIHLPTTAQVLLKPVHDRSKWHNTLKELTHLISEKDIQIIHSHSRSSAKLARHLCKKNSIICHLHTFHGLQKPSLSKKIVNSFGDANIFVCENIRIAMLNDHMKFSQHFETIRNGIRPPPASNSSRSSKFKIGIVSRLSNLKGQRTLQVLRSAISFVQNNHDMEIHLYAGDFESLSKQDQDWIHSSLQQFPSQFFFHGFAKDLSRVFSEYNLICGAGRIAAEALLCKVPVFSFGESTCLGLIEMKNLQEALDSNFGDIKSDTTEQCWSIEGLSLQFKQCLEKFEQNAFGISNPTWAEPVFERVQLEFNFENNFQRILQMYHKTLSRKLRKDYFPILMYHKVVEQAYPTPHKIYVLAKDFEKHLKFYRDSGFTSLHFRDYQKYLEGSLSSNLFPKKPLIITFDDGYLNNLEIALPLLEKYQMKATVFLLANNSIQSNKWDTSDIEEKEFPLMNPQQRLAFSKHPLIEIGSHGFSHAPLDQMTSEMERFAELRNSKLALEQELQCQINVYAFTYGRRSFDASELAKKAGYHYAVNTDSGGMHIEDDPWSIFRISLFPNETFFSLWKKTHRLYRKYYLWKRQK